MKLTSEQRMALGQILDHLVAQDGKSHQGYYGRNGWAGLQLRGLLVQDEPTREIIVSEGMLSAIVPNKQQEAPGVREALQSAELAMREHGMQSHGAYKEVCAALAAAPTGAVVADLRGIDAFTPDEVREFKGRGALKADTLLVQVSDLPKIIARAATPSPAPAAAPAYHLNATEQAVMQSALRKSVTIVSPQPSAPVEAADLWTLIENFADATADLATAKTCGSSDLAHTRCDAAERKLREALTAPPPAEAVRVLTDDAALEAALGRPRYHIGMGTDAGDLWSFKQIKAAVEALAATSTGGTKP